MEAEIIDNIDVDTLFEIVSMMKKYKDGITSYEKLVEVNPSHSARATLEHYSEEYAKALNDFDYWVKNYVIYKEKVNG